MDKGLRLLIVWFLVIIGIFVIIPLIVFNWCDIYKAVSEPTQLGLRKAIVVNDVSITFDSIRFTNKIGKRIANKGYKFVIIDLITQNIGSEEKGYPFYWFNMEIKVDKGYIYEEQYLSKKPSRMRPEDIGTGYVVFEILENTYPIELRFDSDWLDDFCGEYILPISPKDYITTIQTEQTSIEEKNKMVATVNNFEKQKTIGKCSEYGSGCDKADSGKTFLIVDVTVENKGVTGYNMVYPFNFIIKDSEEYVYEKIVTIHLDQEFQSMKIKIGDKVRGKIAFEIPTTAEGLKLIFEDSTIFLE